MPDTCALDHLVFDINCRSEIEYDRHGPDRWRLTVSTATGSEGGEEEPVLKMDGWAFMLGSGDDLMLELDSISADTAVFIPLVDGDELADDLDVEGIGSRLVLINHVVLNPAWRGRGGVGRYLTGLAIRHLDHDAACVALHASPFELRAHYDGADVPAEEWEAGAVALGKLWQTLGFRRHTGHLHILDPATIDLDQAISQHKTRIIAHR
ncbi:hypothetical protein GS979_06355 [Rhodococcus hoagii]|nr:hypothetical protein [Prescottella equi]NKW46036.1 hypothetical protein [Prescottella equi]